MGNPFKSVEEISESIINPMESLIKEHRRLDEKLRNQATLIAGLSSEVHKLKNKTNRCNCEKWFYALMAFAFVLVFFWGKL